MKNYTILLHRDSYTKAVAYLEDLKAGTRAGRYLQNTLHEYEMFHITGETFLERLIQTKHPHIFAESAVRGDGSDWNHLELSILGDVSIATPVAVYDNGRHAAPDIHRPPWNATLLFTPGALLHNGKGHTPADWDEVTKNGGIHPETYYQLYERRLLPVLLYANAVAAQKKRMAFITIPGLGCGQFAGRFRGQLGEALNQTLKTLLHEHGRGLSHLRAIYYDPYTECDNERGEMHGISYLVRSLRKGNDQKPQLCHPATYEEPGDHFADCEFFSVVAWDHVSWPGNDFYLGRRVTDDGVKAAATNAMAVMTGFEGYYETRTHHYHPPEGYSMWRDVIVNNNIQPIHFSRKPHNTPTIMKNSLQGCRNTVTSQ